MKKCPTSAYGAGIRTHDLITTRPGLPPNMLVSYSPVCYLFQLSMAFIMSLLIIPLRLFIFLGLPSFKTCVNRAIYRRFIRTDCVRTKGKSETCATAAVTAVTATAEAAVVVVVVGFELIQGAAKNPYNFP